MTNQWAAAKNKSLGYESVNVFGLLGLPTTQDDSPIAAK
jgi:hypothetical protein